MVYAAHPGLRRAGLLERIPGVKKVNTNAILRETKVTFDSSLVSSKELVDKLNEASLDARVKKTTEKLYVVFENVTSFSPFYYVTQITRYSYRSLHRARKSLEI